MSVNSPNKLEVPRKRSDNIRMMIKTDKETRDRMCWLLRREIAENAVHGAKNWLGTSINRGMWLMVVSDTEALIGIHDDIRHNNIGLALHTASCLDTEVRDVIPTEVWDWMKEVNDLACGSHENIR